MMSVVVMGALVSRVRASKRAYMYICFKDRYYFPVNKQFGTPCLGVGVWSWFGRVRVHWLKERQWLEGVVDKYNEKRRKHRVLYDSGTKRWHHFQAEQVYREKKDGDGEERKRGKERECECKSEVSVSERAKEV